MVRASRVVSSMLAPIAPRRIGQAPPILDGSAPASSIRRRSTAQAAPISLVGSQRRASAEPFPLLGTEVFGTGQEQPPVDPDRVGDGAAAEQVLG